MKRFVINLKRRPDRLEQFFKRCPYPRESFEIVQAFDGRSPDLESKKERNLLQKFRPHIQMGARGCSISHLRIWKKILNEGIPVAMVFEDDAQFNENFLEFMDTLVLPERFNVVYFGGRFRPNFVVPSNHREHVNDKVYKHVYKNQWDNSIHERTTHGYIITLKLAKFLINFFEINELNEEVDHHMIHTMRELNLPYHSTFPLVCWSPMNSESDIR
jgi:glycosyl transferase family 25